MMLQKKGVFNREIVTAFDEGVGWPHIATISVETLAVYLIRHQKDPE